MDFSLHQLISHYYNDLLKTTYCRGRDFWMWTFVCRGVITQVIVKVVMRIEQWGTVA